MYKVLLVDDERIIREGIASIIEWEKYDCSLIGTASNGLEGLNIIKQLKPDIVITDVKMPLMDGIELISKVNSLDEDIKFIVLSGFGEFDLANKAMKYGVKHYLIKPCNENKIIDVLLQVKEEIIKKEKKEMELKSMENSLSKIIPLGKEQFLHDFIMNREFSQNEFDYYMELFNIENENFRLVILNIDGEYKFKNMHYLNYIIKCSSNFCFPYLKATIRRYLVLVFKETNFKKMQKSVESIKKTYKNKLNKNLYAIYSNTGSFREIPNLYNLAYNKLKLLNMNKNNEEIINSKRNNVQNLNERKNNKKYSNLVNRIINSIYENIDNENFSLKWLAREIIFMNEGYLSKVFRKETGEKFSNYLHRIRMEKAISLILEAKEDRVYEVASRVGLGLNPQYFSQLFKKYTGYTPTEYKNAKSKMYVKTVNSN
jgi:two-component system response regulator YesN